jgi:predicted O-methyltransferase YrrM
MLVVPSLSAPRPALRKEAVRAKLETALWYAQRPSHYRQALELARRQVVADHDTPADRTAAQSWAGDRAVDVGAALRRIGLLDSDQEAYPRLPTHVLDEAEDRVQACAVRMGGAGDVRLLYAAARLSEAVRVVETGVAYGWSSLAILHAIADRQSARLVSVDMAYPKRNGEPYVGVVVPDELRAHWALIRLPDRPGLRRALGREAIDLCHYDSDKSWYGRAYAFPLLWNALRPGGVFISDDIQDNLYFARFVERRGAPFAVTEYEGKFAGIARKPG